MTLQVKDLLIYGNKIFQISTLPLDSYLSELKVLPPLVPPSTACWRGYTATWELRNRQLFLVEMTCYSKGDQQAGIELFFAGRKEVFADWFSGEIRLPRGKGKFIIETSLNPLNLKYLVLNFKNGLLQKS